AQLIPHFTSELSTIPLTVPTGALRAPSSNALCFVMNGFLDELAVAGGRDPFDFAYELLGETRDLEISPGKRGPGLFPDSPSMNTGRMRAVLELLEQRSDWRNRKAEPGSGYGMAYYWAHMGY